MKIVNLLVYITFCSCLFFFVLAGIASYEDQYTLAQGVPHSTETMDPYQYTAHLIAYIISFPIGTILSIFDDEYLWKKWIIISIPNFILYYFAIGWIRKMLTKCSSGHSGR